MAQKNLITKIVAGLIYASFTILVLTQLAVSTANLPQGFEQAKVKLIQLLAGAILFCLVNLLVWLASTTLLTQEYNLNAKLPIILALAICFAAMTTSSVFSPYPELAILGSDWRRFGLLTLAAIWVLSLFFLCFSSTKNLQQLLNIYLIGLVVQAFYSYLDIWRYRNELLSSADYINGQFGQANFLADSLLAGLIIIVFKICHIAKLEIKFVWLVLFLYLLLPLLLTQSRTAIGLTIFLIPLSIFNFMKFKIDSKTRLVITVVVTILIAAGLTYFTYHNDLSRQLYWQDMVKVAKERPVIGFGSDTLLAASEDYTLFNGRIVDRAHNLPIDIIYSFGAFGLLSFCLLGVVLVASILRVKFTAQESLVLFLLLLFFLTGLVHTKSVFHYTEAMVWLAILYSSVSKSRSSFKAV